jgi:signal-transduction protein with cAMP-binding, CBS, and nucleotidyltransferase domain
MKNQLIEHISKFIQLNEEEVAAISSQIHIKHYKAGDVLLKEGRISKVSYFNLKGCVRLYYLIDGEEKNNVFLYRESLYILHEKFYYKYSSRSLSRVYRRLCVGPDTF